MIKGLGRIRAFCSLTDLDILFGVGSIVPDDILKDICHIKCQREIDRERESEGERDRGKEREREKDGK